MFQRLFVPLDGSPGTERAIPLAARIARSVRGSLLLLHVISPLPVTQSTTEQSPDATQLGASETQALLEASTYLGSIPETYAAELAGVSLELEVTCGLTSPILASTVRLEQIDLMVLCSHREVGLGEWGRASIAWQALRQQIGALLILKEQGMGLQPDQAYPLRALVPLDGSLVAETALEPASHLLAQLSRFGELPSEMHLVRVAAACGAEYEQAEDYLQAMTERLTKLICREEKRLITSSVVVGDDVAEALLAQAQTSGCAPFIAMATHGREGVQRLVWGNITERVLNAAICPLLIVSASGSNPSVPSSASGDVPLRDERSSTCFNIFSCHSMDRNSRSKRFPWPSASPAPPEVLCSWCASPIPSVNAASTRHERSSLSKP